MGLVVFSAAGVGLLAWLLTVGSDRAAGQSSAGRVTTVTVTAGKPSELSFKLSKSSNITPGLVVFKVTNGGKLTHDFKICTRPATSMSANSCTGKVTMRLKPGQSTLMAALTLKKGQYEFLCTVPGHASAGMKGLVGIGVKVSAATNNDNNLAVGGTTTTKTTTTTTTSTGVTETLVGNPANGASVWASAGCAACHTLRAAGATGTVGPDLDQAKPGQDLVIQRVTNGINVMPAFGSQLSTSQIQDVASYVYSSTHT
jgi:mono/diheme cytochrome c family protein